mmetsp:Transcript_334/g.768  ORF Transcript_334/g.768 Transcript_334/m.768 type:complete len:144 (-) Transcript_334:125-556(-)
MAATSLWVRLGAVQLRAWCFFFVANFAYGWGPIVWVYNSEIFPLRHRSQCVATAACANWIGNYAIAQFTPILLGRFGFLTFYLFGAFAFVAMLLSSWLPETKGVMLEHMQRIFDEKLGGRHCSGLNDPSLRSKYGASLLLAGS